MSSTNPNDIIPDSYRNKIFALVDCNNFYASCERLFNPRLEKKPVIVLSNNDGCVIARSDEAKAIGIKMGAPAFEFEELIARYRVHVFSSNYALYGDISNRIMSVLFELAPDVEVYSVDEAFLDLTGMKYEELTAYAGKIRKVLKQWVGVPVSVGIGPTKTLAKIANHLAKKKPRNHNILNLCAENDPDEVFKNIPISEIWGVGPAFDKLLQEKNIRTILDFKNTDEHWIRKHMGVIGQKTLYEIRGISCISLEKFPPDKKNICISRSFGVPVTSYEELEQATSTFATRAAEKIRSQHSCARAATLFIMTNRFSNTPKYVNSVVVQFPVATNSSAEIIHYALKGLKKIFRQGYLYKKSGILLSDLIPENQLQYSVWDDVTKKKIRELMQTVDKINARVGQGVVKFAVQGTKRRWKMHQERLSPKYTSNWNDILIIEI